MELACVLLIATNTATVVFALWMWSEAADWEKAAESHIGRISELRQELEQASDIKDLDAKTVEQLHKVLAGLTDHNFNMAARFDQILELCKTPWVDESKAKDE